DGSSGPRAERREPRPARQPRAAHLREHHPRAAGRPVRADRQRGRAGRRGAADRRRGRAGPLAARGRGLRCARRAEQRGLEPLLVRPAGRLLAAHRAAGGGAHQPGARARGVPAHQRDQRRGHRHDHRARRRGVPRGAALPRSL
ncbi:MAG: 3-dehydroquinate dehydratase II, partial [uncultured Nocardioides sp.]